LVICYFSIHGAAWGPPAARGRRQRGAFPLLLEMKKAGASTLAQDEAGCVVYGMPNEAVRRGAVDRNWPLQAISAEIMQHLRG
jgi:chemotaxis response regulator CheB